MVSPVGVVIVANAFAYLRMKVDLPSTGVWRWILYVKLAAPLLKRSTVCEANAVFCR